MLLNEYYYIINMVYKYKNTSIHYDSLGNGPSTILLHGFLESSHMWESFLPELSKDRNIITLDLPGLGESGVLSDVHSMDLMADVVNEILLHLKIQKASFVGHSMGGYITMAFAELFPDKVEKIILLNSTPVADSSERKKTRDRALKILDRSPHAFISMAIANWAGEKSRDQFAEAIENSKKLAYTFPVAGIKAALRGMKERPDRTHILKNFARSKFMLLAEDDPIIPLDETLAVADECGAQAKIVSGGHLSTLENQVAVMEFLQQRL